MSLEKIGKLKNAILMGIVAVIVFSTSAYASGLLSSNKTAMNTTGVIATAAVGVYSDAAATQNMTSINWGTCYPGSNYTYVVYVKNALIGRTRSSPVSTRYAAGITARL